MYIFKTQPGPVAKNATPRPRFLIRQYHGNPFSKCVTIFLLLFVVNFPYENNNARAQCLTLIPLKNEQVGTCIYNKASS